ncbi:MAG TPA: GNAT family N-acetyltransferase [Thermoplasmata archaeon]|nr:GNAT family N-acetyltransferase [Thermoplasmata archaeon]
MKPASHAHRTEPAGTVIRRVEWASELDRVRRLFRGYRDWLAGHASPPTGSGPAVLPALARLDRVIADLPGVYGPPGGDVLLAVRGPDVVACGALRAWEPRVGEIKRIYVRADHRGPVFGPKLVRALLARAEELGYDRVRVDALPSMEAAIQYYQEMGFRPIPAYWAHPVPGARFFEWSAAERAPVRRGRGGAPPRRSGA